MEEITITQLERAREVLNIAGIARLAGMSEQTLYSKIKNKTNLDEWAGIISGVLYERGVMLQIEKRDQLSNPEALKQKAVLNQAGEVVV